MNPESIREKIMQHHTSLIEQLEVKYMNYIQTLLTQKCRLVIKINNIFREQLHNLNETTTCAQNVSVEHDDNDSLLSSISSEESETQSAVHHRAKHTVTSTLSDGHIVCNAANFWNDPCDEKQIHHEDDTVQQVNVEYDMQSTPQSVVETSSESNERPFKCSYDGCNKTFKQKGSANQHMRVHSDERPFECTYDGCSKAFKHKSNLKAHKRIHTGERPFKCTFDGCNKSCKQRGHLTVHMRTHTGERPYECNICNRRFISSGRRNEHIKNVHR